MAAEESASVLAEWSTFLRGADSANGVDLRADEFYSETANAIIKFMGNNFVPQDLAEDCMRDHLKEVTKEWRNEGLTPSHIALVSRAQKVALSEYGGIGLATSGNPLEDAVTRLAELQEARLDAKDPNPKLKYDLAQRLRDVGLCGLADEMVPSTESLAKLQSWL